MGRINRQPPVKLICGFIFREQPAYEKAKRFLEKKFGPLDFESENLAFDHTTYYEKEFGAVLSRKFISFQKLIPAGCLAQIKALTIKYEQELSRGRNRLVNIDPGFLDLGKLTLATTKDHKHRVFIGRGIYAEVTLYFEDKTYKPWEWTYPDYKSAEYIGIFNRIREFYRLQLKPCTLHT
ncbi:MAG: DUF4416 family protein [Candidatus Omnitrophica bacterium]|nr:DUF4416 family protein [Candidatus Omnitrophota bacterium]